MILTINQSNKIVKFANKALRVSFDVNYVKVMCVERIKKNMCKNACSSKLKIMSNLEIAKLRFNLTLIGKDRKAGIWWQDYMAMFLWEKMTKDKVANGALIVTVQSKITKVNIYTSDKREMENLNMQDYHYTNRPCLIFQSPEN